MACCLARTSHGGFRGSRCGAGSTSWHYALHVMQNAARRSKVSVIHDLFHWLQVHAHFCFFPRRSWPFLRRRSTRRSRSSDFILPASVSPTPFLYSSISFSFSLGFCISPAGYFSSPTFPHPSIFLLYTLSHRLSSLFDTSSTSRPFSPFTLLLDIYIHILLLPLTLTSCLV